MSGGGWVRRTLVAYAGFARRPRVPHLPGVVPGPRDHLDLDAVRLGHPPIGRDLGGRELGGRDTVVLVARSATDLRRAATAAAAVLPEAARVVVMVQDAPPDGGLPLPRPGALWPPLLDIDVRRRDAGWSLRLRLARPYPAGEIAAAVARALGVGGGPAGRVPSAVAAIPGVPAVGLSGAGAAHWRPGDPGVIAVPECGPVPADLGPPAVDLVLRCAGGPVAWADPYVPALDLPDELPPVDERVINPAGFVATPRRGTGALAATRSAPWAVTLDDGVVTEFPPSGCVGDADIARLRDLRAVAVRWDGRLRPVAAARVVAALAAAGVPLVTERPPPGWARRLIGGDLAALLGSVTVPDLADDLRREEHSVRLRRCALRGHGVRARWLGLAAAAGLPAPPEPKVSVVLCTRRPGRIRFALEQIARQRLADVEVVVGLHGVPADAIEVAAALRGFGRPHTVVEIDADVPFGTALNRAAALASGTHLAKMDDDDWYGPEHLADMLLAAAYSGADLVGCAAEFVYLEDPGVTVRRRAWTERPADHVAGGTMVMSRDVFAAAGGFRPIHRSVDAYLLRAILACGGLVYRTHGLGYVLRRCATGHTWDEPAGYFLRGARRQWQGFRPSALLDAAGPWLPAAGKVPASGQVGGPS